MDTKLENNHRAPNGTADAGEAGGLTVLLVGRDAVRRAEIAAALVGTKAHSVHEEAVIHPEALPPGLAAGTDVLIVVLDEKPDDGLRLVEAACEAAPALTVMVCAHAADAELLMRCMRAGAREFLSDPVSGAAIRDAVLRASTRRDEIRRHGKTGKCLVFVGAKGGSGVSTIAGNFAVALVKETAQSVVLLDLNLRLGDVALDLGASGEFSTLDALRNEARLDSDLVASLLVKHDSGLLVLPAPDEYNAYHPDPPAVMKLIGVLMRNFDWLVVDAGTHENGFGPQLFDVAEKVYLVTQISIPELRNSNRFISALFKGKNSAKLEVIINRCDNRAGDINDASIARALTVAPAWKVPNDYDAVRTAQNTATALPSTDNPIARVLTRMASSACGKPAEELRKRRFALFQ